MFSQFILAEMRKEAKMKALKIAEKSASETKSK
jgi:hypothetical protein